MRRRWARLRSLSPAQWRVVVVSLMLLPAVQLSLRLRGFAPTLESLGRWSARRRRTARGTDAGLVADAVVLVASRPVVGSQCLGRSLVLWCLLRSHGIDAELVIGAEPPGASELSAHSWVEVGGRPLIAAIGTRDRFGSFRVPQPRLRPTPLHCEPSVRRGSAT